MAINFNQKVQIFADQLAEKDFDFEEAASTFAKLDKEMEAAGATISILAKDPMATLRCMFSTANLADPISGDPIKPTDFITVGGYYFDANELMKGVLSQTTLRNPMDRQPLTEIELEQLCAHFNVNTEDFQSLWPLAEAELRQHTDLVMATLETDAAREQYLTSETIDADNADYKREARLRLFDQLPRYKDPLPPMRTDPIPVLDTRPASGFCHLLTKIAVAGLVAISGIALTYLR